MPLPSRCTRLKHEGPASATRPCAPAAAFAAAATLAGWLLLPGSAYALTALQYTNSEKPWRSVLATPELGFEFWFIQDAFFKNGLFFSLNNYNATSDPQFQNTWDIGFAAPHRAPLTVGHYADAFTFPFQTGDAPGLMFGGNGYGPNIVTGNFTVREARYGQDGALLEFAADFMQYENRLQDQWSRGSFRYNSTIPIAAVPEPASWAILLAGLAFIGVCTQRAARRHPGSQRRIKAFQ